jgi:pectin methylesterase-like acyl-CoA thioesterase
VTIRIRPATYRGQIYVPASKPGITLAGTTGRPQDEVLRTRCSPSTSWATRGGTVSAPDTGLEQPYGYLITGSRIVNRPGNLAAASYYLGRPWRHTGVTSPVGAARYTVAGYLGGWRPPGLGGRLSP